MSGNLNQTRVSLHPSFIQTITVGLGVPPGHAPGVEELAPVFQQQAVGLHTARGLYHRSGITPCPEGFYLVVEIIPRWAQIA